MYISNITCVQIPRNVITCSYVLIFQIYEWCCHTTHLAEEAKDDTCVTGSAKGDDEQLPDDQKHLIIN